MRHPIYLQLCPSEKFDFIKFIEDFSNGRSVDLNECQLFKIDNPLLHFKEEFIQYIAKYGYTNFLQMRMIFEDLTTPSTPVADIKNILINYLSTIGIDDELIIIDPYFFPPNANSDYINIICDILSPFFSSLSKIRIVTASHSRAYSSSAKNNFISSLQYFDNTINVIHSKTNEIHDRFWISNARKKGILTGTSLNGLGKKYAIIDYLEDSDVQTIISEFSSQGLI